MSTCGGCARSINVLGPLLARYGRARVAMPGGDNIGSRKLDMHFAALTAMGAELDVRNGFIEARANALAGAPVMLDFPSVGATETVLTAAVLAKGETVIETRHASPRSSTSARSSASWARRSRACRDLDAAGRGRPRPHRDRAHHHRGPHRGGHAALRVRDRRRRHRRRGCPARAPRDGPPQAHRDGRDRRARPGRHRGGRRGSPRPDRRADAPVPGYSSRLHAARRGWRRTGGSRARSTRTGAR